MSENKYFPVVIVPGIGQSRVEQIDDQGNFVKRAWPLSVKSDALMDKLKGPFMKMMLFRRDMGFTDAAAGLVKDVISGVATSSDGSMRQNLRAVTYNYPLSECSDDEKRYIIKMAPVKELAEKIGEENIFFMAYNSFEKPYSVAGQLADFIAYVKEKTGSDKVNILALSLGGAMLTAYLDEYGAKDIHRIVYMVPALQGSKTVTDIFNKNIKTDDASSLIKALTNEKTAQSAGAVFSMLPEGILGKLADKALSVLIDDVLTGSGAVWALLPPEDYEEIADKYIGDTAHAALRKETDRYHLAQKNLRNTLLSLQKEGVGIYICACFSLPLMKGLGSSDEYSSDGIINISSASLGARAAAPGKELEESEINDKNFLSPNRNLDASFGAFPDNTWYFEGQFHDSIAYNNTALNIAFLALSEEEFKDIHSNGNISQFNKKEDNRK
ncbi:MAG: alpha/beta fold hydrolase [Oscillospiraceae bacterium]|nr:alpha/beta fold hydrolase [Oscillospiraceae bacterium]